MALLSRRTMRWFFVGLMLPWAAELEGADAAPAKAGEKFWVFVGTYGKGPDKGVFRLELDAATGKLSEAKLAAALVNPTFLAIPPSGRFLYAVGENKGQAGRGVIALSLDPKTGALAVLNEQSSGGDGPCHLTVDREGKNVLVANYGGGSAAALPIGRDGRLNQVSATVKFSGSGPGKGQKMPHAHSVNMDAANRFAFIADVGTDRVWIYRFDAGQGRLDANEPGFAAVAPGAGPRHFAFHPNGKNAYVINELNSTMTAFKYDADRGALTELQSLSTLPAGFKGKSFCAEVVVHPSGKFVYGSNRGHDSIAVFKVDADSGRLTPAGYQGDQIKTPRNFAIDPTGMYMIVANQDSNSLMVFRVNQESGELTPTGSRVEVPSPVCVRMIPQAR